MPPKRRGALQLIRRDLDQLETQAERLLKDVQSQDGSSEEALWRCQDLQMSAEKTQRTLKKLTKADELAPVGNYEERKQDEERRLQDILERLNSLSLELSPPGPSTAAGNVLKEDEEEDEDSSDDDDDGDEEQAVNAPSEPHVDIYTALSDFRGEQDGDLSVQRGEVVRIIRRTADGWWLAQDTKGNRGVVPKTYLKAGSAVEDDEDDDDDDDNDEKDDDDSEEEEELTDDQHKHRFYSFTLLSTDVADSVMSESRG
ncbi:nephrocystin-1-like [Sebastes fasciatus]|uniref:nephrocystin-1-like n=1 Tax=Sebastes fasciatus TaxID=394691 RepID=UPI003D9E8F26